MLRVPTAGVVLTGEHATELNELHRAAAEESGPHRVVILLDLITSMTPEARAGLKKMTDSGSLDGAALVGSTYLARAIGRFFIALRRPDIPFRVFSDLNGAVEWANSLPREP